MKRLLLTLGLAVILLVVVSSEAYASRPTVWLLGGTDVQAEHDNYIGRIGLRDDSGIEFGFESAWAGIRGKEYNQSYGCFLLTEIPSSIPVPGVPYLGIHVAVAFDDEDIGFYGPFTGTLIPIGDKVDSMIEFQYLKFNGNLALDNPEFTDEYKLYAGLRFKF